MSRNGPSFSEFFRTFIHLLKVGRVKTAEIYTNIIVTFYLFLNLSGMGVLCEEFTVDLVWIAGSDLPQLLLAPVEIKH